MRLALQEWQLRPLTHIDDKIPNRGLEGGWARGGGGLVDYRFVV